MEGFDVSDNADATVNDFQHNPSVSDGGVDKSTQAASIMGTPYFKRPFSGGQDPSAGFKYATAQKVQLDLVGNRKGWASNESEAPQLNPSDALCEVPVVPQVTGSWARDNTDASNDSNMQTVQMLMSGTVVPRITRLLHCPSTCLRDMKMRLSHREEQKAFHFRATTKV